MATDIKLCKDCKHCIRNTRLWWFCLFLPLAPIYAWWALNYQWRFARCRRAPLEDNNPYRLTGARVKPKPKSQLFDYCSVERDLSWCCGPEAKFFEKKEANK